MDNHLLAQIYVPGLPAGLGGAINNAAGTETKAAGGFISGIASLLLIIAAVAAFIFFVLGGLQWITAGGEKAQLEAARNRITHAIVGLIIVGSAWAVWILVGQFLGVDVTNLSFPTLTGGAN